MAATKATKRTTGNPGLTAEEKAAMKAMLKERNAQRGKEADEKACLDAIAAMSPRDRSLAQQVHALVKKAAPGLNAKTWYGFPAYANADDEVICFFKPADKFKERYATLGFNQFAKLDDGPMWATSFALLKLTAGDERKLAALVKKAAS